MDGWTDRRTDGRTDGLTDGCIDGGKALFKGGLSQSNNLKRFFGLA
jgi:hypothetical protein